MHGLKMGWEGDYYCVNNSVEPRTCQDIGIQQCCNEDTAGEGGCIVYYHSGATTNNEGCSCALSCHQSESNDYQCCPDAVQIGCVRKSCIIIKSIDGINLKNLMPVEIIINR